MFQNFGSPMYQNNNSVTSGLENASQNAFQSAQSFIGAFSSISMMLESTLFAVQNSVRAIAGMDFISSYHWTLKCYLLWTQIVEAKNILLVFVYFETAGVHVQRCIRPKNEGPFGEFYCYPKIFFCLLGVADQFGHLRHYLLSSAASFYRLVNYYYKKILCVLRLKQPDTQDERFWRKCA